jgi:hypothetical protein
MKSYFPGKFLLCLGVMFFLSHCKKTDSGANSIYGLYQVKLVYEEKAKDLTTDVILVWKDSVDGMVELINTFNNNANLNFSPEIRLDTLHGMATKILKASDIITITALCSRSIIVVMNSDNTFMPEISNSMSILGGITDNKLGLVARDTCQDIYQTYTITGTKIQ